MTLFLYQEWDEPEMVSVVKYYKQSKLLKWKLLTAY